MALIVYRDAPFFSGTEVDQSDFFTGTGATTAFTLARKGVNRLAGTVQFDGTQYYFYNGGFTKTGTGFVTNTAPALNTQGVAPGQSALLFDQLFDQDDVPGLDTPRVQEIPFYLVDNSEIPLFEYVNIPSLGGIELSFVDMISSVGAQTSWVQLACASPDEVGSALTYEATGTPLYTGTISAYGTLDASSAQSATSISVDLASGIGVGDYIMVNGGQPSQEIVKVIGYTAPTTLTTTGQTYDHYSGETVYVCGRKFWAKCTVPLDATDGLAANYFDLSLRTRFAKRSRL